SRLYWLVNLLIRPQVTPRARPSGSPPSAARPAVPSRVVRWRRACGAWDRKRINQRSAVSVGSGVRFMPANTHWLRGNGHQTDDRRPRSPLGEVLRSIRPEARYRGVTQPPAALPGPDGRTWLVHPALPRACLRKSLQPRGWFAVLLRRARTRRKLGQTDTAR